MAATKGKSGNRMLLLEGGCSSAGCLASAPPGEKRARQELKATTHQLARGSMPNEARLLREKDYCRLTACAARGNYTL